MPWLDSIRKQGWVLTIVLVYLLADMLLTFHEIYVLNLLPVFLIIVFLALTRLDIMFFLIVLLTPISISLIEYIPSSPIDFYIPTEPLLFGVMIVFIYKLVSEGKINREVINHPVTYAILFNLFWIFLTSITSSMPLVSFKFLLARMWFLTTFYFLAIFIFRNTNHITTYIWCYSLSMLVVVIYSISRHLGYGLYDKEASNLVMSPFFRDHTSYGAVLAMLFFALGGVILRGGTNIVLRFLYWTLFLTLTAGLILSYTRAAWLSVFGAFGVMVLTLLKVKFRYVAFAAILILFYFVGQRVEIIHKLERNRQDRSADLTEQVKSISNITTDDSNLERLNRWTSALRMFRERPILGWGPGTYMFKYAPFQLSSKKTLISTDFGDKGNAHSEYIGPLSESGVLGALSIMFIAVMALITGFKVYRILEEKRLKQLVLALILGFITYLAHGTLNNFLDTDKASALFWGFIAVFVSLDVYYLPEQKRSISKESTSKN
jgi:putative inorganic carbon (hco3(-)) transporter